MALVREDNDAVLIAPSSTGAGKASASLDGTLRIWTVPRYSAQYQTIVGLFTNQNQCWGLAWSPNDDEVATVGDDGSVRIWDVSVKAQQIRLRGGEGRLTMDNDQRLLFNNKPLTTSELQDFSCAKKPFAFSRLTSATLISQRELRRRHWRIEVATI